MANNQVSDADVFRLLTNKDWPAVLELIDSGRLLPNSKLIVSGLAGRHTLFLLPYILRLDANEVVRSLLDKGANPNQFYEGQTPLLAATEKRNHEAMEMLLNAGADLEATAKYTEDGGGETALLIAAEQLDLWAVERLLKVGADPARFTKKRRQTAIWFVSRDDCQKRLDERTAIIRRLIDAGCKLRGNELHWPVYHRDAELTSLLLELGCPADEPSLHNEFDGPRKGDTPLTLAIEESVLDLAHSVTRKKETFPKLKAQIINRLLSAQADPNIPNGQGQTPLLLATIGNDLQTARKLLAAGADPNLSPPNCKMGSAIQLATKRNLVGFTSLFEQAGS